MEHEVVSRERWLEARRALLAKEKELTRQREALAAERRALPWVAVEKEYVFEGAQGKLTLAEAFAGRSQLVVYHFMFGPEWDEGCPSCSFWADSFDRLPVHLAARDVSFVAVSRAPYAKLAPFHQRLGWSFPWLSSHGSDFNWDFHVSFTPEEVEQGSMVYNFGRNRFPSDEGPGISVFGRDEAGAGRIFHTYSTFARGLDWMNAAYHYLDLVPKGRDEAELSYNQAWVRHRDRY